MARVPTGGDELTATEELFTQNATALSAAGAGEFFRKTSATAVEHATPSGSIGGSTGGTDNAILRANGTGGATIQSTGVIIDDSNNLFPNTSDGAALGSATKMWSDLFLADGAVINFNNGDVTLTHSANALTLAGGDLTVPNLTVQTNLTAENILGEASTSLDISAASGQALNLSTIDAATPGDINLDAGNATSGNTNGGGLILLAGNGFGDGDGGLVSLGGGNAASGGNGSGGSFELTGGIGRGSGSGGEVTFNAGDASGTGTGGNIEFISGSGDGGGGDMLFTAGSGTDGNANGGIIFLAPGLHSGAGTKGRVYISDPSSGLEVIFNTDNIATSDKTFTFPNASGTFYVTGGTDVALADGGTGASLADPGADRIMFWDESAGAVDWLIPGTGLTITDKTISASSGGDLVATAFPGSGYLSTATLSADVGPTFFKPVISYPNSGQSLWNVNVKVPSGATSISSIKVYYVRARTGNIWLRFYSGRIDGDSAAAAQEDVTDTGAVYASSGSDSAVDAITVPSTSYNGLTNIDADDIIYLQIYRDAAQGTDTYEGTFLVTHVEFTFA